MLAAKGFLRLSNLHMLIKQKSITLPRNLALRSFGELLIVFSTKVNLILYDDSRLEENKNRSILIATISYIKNTERFSGSLFE